MSKKTITLISSGVALAFSVLTVVYSMNLIEQQNKIQQIKLESVWSIVNEQISEVKKLKEENKNDTLDYSEYVIENNNTEAKTDGEQYLKLIKQFKSTQAMLKQFNIEQQRLASESKQQNDKINALSLSLETTGIATNTSNERLSEEQKLAKDKMENEQYIKSLTTHWEQQEPTSSEITQTAERATQELFEQAKGMNVSAVDCKQDLCRLEITLTEDAENSPVDWLMMEADMSKVMGTEVAEITSEEKINADGSESVIIYLSKEQTRQADPQNL